jgi:hypothetical protein
MIKCPAKVEFNPFKEMKGGEDWTEVCTESCEQRALGKGCANIKECNAYKAKKIEEEENE